MTARGDKTPVFESRLQQAQDRWRDLLGEDTLLQFRSDLREVYVRTTDTDDVTEYQKLQWVNIGRRGLQETRHRFLTFEKGLNVLDVSDAFLSLALIFVIRWIAQTVGVPLIPSFLVGISLSLLFFWLNSGLVLTKAFVNEIAFPAEEIHSRLPPGVLRFRAGWNKGVIQSNTCLLGLIFYGAITAPGKRSYKIGLDFVEWWQERKG